MFGYLSIYLSIYIYILKKGKKIVWQQRKLKIIRERERESAKELVLVVGKLTWHNFNKIKNKNKNKNKNKTKQRNLNIVFVCWENK